MQFARIARYQIIFSRFLCFASLSLFSSAIMIIIIMISREREQPTQSNDSNVSRSRQIMSSLEEEEGAIHVWYLPSSLSHYFLALMDPAICHCLPDISSPFPARLCGLSRLYITIINVIHRRRLGGDRDLHSPAIGNAPLQECQQTDFPRSGSLSG